MKIKLLNACGYSHKYGIEFPIIIDDDKALVSSKIVLISSKVLVKAGFTNMNTQNHYAFCLAGHAFGREAVIL